MVLLVLLPITAATTAITTAAVCYCFTPNKQQARYACKVVPFLFAAAIDPAAHDPVTIAIAVNASTVVNNFNVVDFNKDCLFAVVAAIVAAIAVAVAVATAVAIAVAVAVAAACSYSNVYQWKIHFAHV